MAIITISRQLGSLGDEIGKKIAEKLGYKFFGKEDIEKRIIELGFPKSKLEKYDDRKIGFFAGLTRGRDEYLNYLLTAILEAASENKSVIVGRGSFFILKELENHISCRFIADENVRVKRLQTANNLSKKNALKIISENDMKQKSFHKEFFNFDINDSSLFDLIINTEKLETDAVADSIVMLVNSQIPVEKDKIGQKKIEELLIAQRIADILIFIYNLDIKFLRINMEDKKITLHGVAEKSSVVDSALTIVEAELPGYEISSAISISQDFKAYY